MLSLPAYNNIIDFLLLFTEKMNGKRNADRPFGQAVLITGANRGIGLELCRQLASDPQGPDLIFAAYKNNARISVK